MKNQLEKEVEHQFQELKRGSLEIIPEEAFREKLKKSLLTNTPLKIKAGFDPTAKDLHLGHTVLLQKMRQFQEFGHEVYFLIGDYTAMIGDPTGKSETRKRLSREEVLENAETYKEQVFLILDPEKTNVVFNSEWLSKMNLADIIELTARYTVAQLLEREDFAQRYQNQKAISLVEFLYPLLQGYDSVALKADVELGGSDQKFNLLVGRYLQQAYGQEGQCILTMPLLVGLDGEKKMSKSLNNYVGIKEEPIEIFGKIMSISDPLMWDYYLLLSNLTLNEVEELKKDVQMGKIHPKEAKARLAEELAARFHSKEKAEKARSEWEKIHSPVKRGLPEEIPEFQISLNPEQSGVSLIEVCKICQFASSNGEARRLMEGGGLHLIENENEVLLKNPKEILPKGSYILRAGKRRFALLTIT